MKEPIQLVYTPGTKHTLTLNLAVSASSEHINEIYPDIAKQLRQLADDIEFEEVEFI